ncbi:MAG: type II toxin-antitoxin system RelE/ParE family toxin [Marinospirillum sp.]|uniref:type II toxin-antitoxin system RelE/ParE family toxin n=1 Tax=Marinospirillum sp. TaxID=2183934 RepID=UPI0019F90ABF|nr:type II toxin-antitoxin system RelE/ParE family toxin [Marinospirillum sp.]MBE0506488.1 type II toxin-antitoxin system RelE/ParE family toxin [Marinospirillum sp.]
MEYQLLTTTKFDKWFSSIKDKSTRFRVEARLSQLSSGHFGDHKSIDSNISELRCFFGGGLRIYYTVRNTTVILLLTGGDKSTQSRDIEQAVTLFKQLEEER